MSAKLLQRRLPFGLPRLARRPSVSAFAVLRQRTARSRHEKAGERKADAPRVDPGAAADTDANIGP